VRGSAEEGDRYFFALLRSFIKNFQGRWGATRDRRSKRIPEAESLAGLGENSRQRSAAVRLGRYGIRCPLLAPVRERW
jgi:hypothetical protein